jgi:hypothetical protein
MYADAGLGGWHWENKKEARSQQALGLINVMDLAMKSKVVGVCLLSFQGCIPMDLLLVPGS